MPSAGAISNLAIHKQIENVLSLEETCNGALAGDGDRVQCTVVKFCCGRFSVSIQILLVLVLVFVTLLVSK